MANKRHTPEQVINKLRQAEVAMSTGNTMVETVRQMGVTEQTFYRWRNEYGGLSIDQAKRLKQIEAENSRLKRATAVLRSSMSRNVEPARYSVNPGPLSGIRSLPQMTSSRSHEISSNLRESSEGTVTAGSQIYSDIKVGE